MDMNAGKQAHRRNIICLFTLICILALPIYAAAQDDTFVPPQEFDEAFARKAWEKGDLEKTQSLLDKSLVRYPESALLWDIQAGVELKKKNYEKAAEAAKKALKIAPTPTRYSNLGWIYQHMGQYTRAVTYYKMGLSGEQEIKEYYYRLGECLEKTDRQKEAVTYYRRYLEVSPDGPNRGAAQKRLASLMGTAVPGETADPPPAVSGGLASLSPEQRRRFDENCSQRFPGMVAVDYDPQAKKVTCGCPDGGIDTGEGCLHKLELEIMRAVNRKDFDQAIRLAAQVPPGTKFYTNVLEDVKYLAKIRNETPWMLDQDAFNQEMARRDREFQNAMQEYDRQQQQNNEQWAKLRQTTLEAQMKAISNAVAAANSTPPTQAFVPGDTRPADTPGQSAKINFAEDKEQEETQMTDRLVLMQTPVTDDLDPGDYLWYPPLDVDKDEIVGVWMGDCYKIAVMKDGEKGYVAKVLETYPVERFDRKGLVRYPFSPGEVCCRVGQPSGGGSEPFLSYSGDGWVWKYDVTTGTRNVTTRTWDRQELDMRSNDEGLYLRFAYSTCDSPHEAREIMRKVQ